MNDWAMNGADKYLHFTMEEVDSKSNHSFPLMIKFQYPTAKIRKDD